MHYHSGWRPISKATWDKCWNFSQKIEDQKRSWSTPCYYVYEPHFYGLLGEALVSDIIKLPFNTELKYEGDGGSDFLGYVDVKTSTFCKDPHLKVFPRELNEHKVFALVGLCLQSKCAKYFGYATTDMLRQAPTIDYGRGIRRVLVANELVLEAPPILQVK